MLERGGVRPRILAGRKLGRTEVDTRRRQRRPRNAGLTPARSCRSVRAQVQRAASQEADDASDRQEDRTSPCVLSEEISQRLRQSAFFNASHAARCVASHGVGSHAVPIALVGECSIPVVQNVARQPCARLFTEIPESRFLLDSSSSEIRARRRR
jgi:hypothetical protein